MAMATTAVEVAEATPVAGVVMGEATTSNSPTSVAVADEVSTAEIALAVPVEVSGVPVGLAVAPPYPCEAGRR